jgi:MFS family permease
VDVGLKQAGRRPAVAYKWIALSNTSLGAVMAFMNQTIILISLPAIFVGLGVDPTAPGESSLLLWVLMSYNVATTVFLVTFGRLSDNFGKVRFYNLGFVVFTVGSLMCALVPGKGASGAAELIAFRFVQGIGGALLMSNSVAILTDAFPRSQRGLAMGVNQVVGVSGSVLGLVAGGLLATVNWRLVFVINVPVGIIGTIWAYLKLRDIGERTRQPIDWLGNMTFAVGLLALLSALTYALLPYGGQAMGWTNPWVESGVAAGVLLLGLFAWIESRAPYPMIQLSLFRIRDFWAGNLAGFLGSLGRGGLQFLLVIWLQAVWLPLHGVAFAQTPFQAGIDTLPMLAGFVLAGPIGGAVSDRIGARWIATGGMIVSAVGFALLATLPADFSFPVFAVYLLLIGVGMGMFAAPNTASIMNSVPASDRAVASGMRATFMNAATVMSMAVFFTIVIGGLSGTLPASLRSGLLSAGAPTALAEQLSNLPPAAALFSALLGYNLLQAAVSPSVMAGLDPKLAANLVSPHFFSQLFAGPMTSSLRIVFAAGVAMSLVAALASALRRGARVEVAPNAGAAAPPQPLPKVRTVER